MWIFVETVRIESDFGSWSALVTLVKDDVQESFYLGFGANEPSLADADAAGIALAASKTAADELPPAPVQPSDFMSRFTGDEVTALWSALDTLESLGIIGYGRAAELRT